MENKTLPQGFMTPPAYDSGWVDFSPNEEILMYHGLDTTEVLVYLTGNRCSISGDWNGIHQCFYGGNEDDAGRREGGMWYNLSSTHIRVWRLTNDVDWEQIRVQMWKIRK